MLPRLPCEIPRSRAEVVALRGINFSDQVQDGDLAWTENLSARRWPLLTQRRARAKQTAYSGCTAMCAWEKLVAVQGGQLLFDGQAVGAVTPGEKQFAVVNTRLVVWPDKVYLDLNSLTMKSLAAQAAGAGAVFTANTVKLTGGPALTARFAVGDTISISGCISYPANNKSVTIRGLTADTVTVSANTFAAGTENHAVTLERKIPDLDYICESENRLWGCSNSARTIYASALGDPCNFFTYSGLSTDSYALGVGSEGDFTGCCRLGSSILFWKENALHKLLGSYPAEYSLYTYHMEGLRKGCHKSLQVINEVLYYMGLHGVYAYSGASPALISQGFGERRFSGAVAGTDGERYFLSVKEGTDSHLLVYDTALGLWLREDGTKCADFARMGRDLYILDGQGNVWLEDGGQEDPDIRWTARFTPFYETLEGRKRYSRLVLRVELPRGSWMQARMRCDGGPWEDCGRLVGSTHDAVPLRLAVRRCDRFELELSGRGPCSILSLLREFSVGSER